MMFLLCLPPVVAQSQNSPADADILGKQIETAFNTKDYEHIVELTRQLHALGGHFPPPLWYVEADAYYHLGKKTAALNSLNGYFSQAERDKYPYNEAVTLAATIRDDISSKSHAEANFKWTGTVKGSSGAVMLADVDLQGQSVREEGITLECSFWLVSGQPIDVTLDSDSPNAGQTQGAEVAEGGLWQHRKTILTVHFPPLGMPPSLSNYNVPPWFGSYDFNAQRWSKLTRSDHTLRLSDYDLRGWQRVNGNYDWYLSGYGHTVNIDMHISLGETASLSLDDMTWSETLEWHTSGKVCEKNYYYCHQFINGLLSHVGETHSHTGFYPQGTSGQAVSTAPCKVLPYRQPPNPH
jgi:hypothetical protein